MCTFAETFCYLFFSDAFILTELFRYEQQYGGIFKVKARLKWSDSGKPSHQQ